MGDICPAKHFCPEGCSEPSPCPEGTYSNSTGQSVCKICPTGHTCADGEVVQCPAGYYCPEELDADPIPCPPGTFSPTPGMTRAEDCLSCLPGMFCRGRGSSAVSGPCQPGFFCTASSLVPHPAGTRNESFGGPCPVGHFCPAGTSLPSPCPYGTFSDRLYLSAESQCTPCSPGYSCSSIGLSAPTEPCQAGYYCTLGASSSAPTGTGGGGGCPLGHYCPAGSAHPYACPAGTYNNRTHQRDCLPCPAGYYCAENTSDYSAFQCPAGFYCPGGTKHGAQFPCPRGYYNPDLRTHSLDSCLPCPSGHYCGVEGLGAVSGKCDPGWFCVSAAWTPQPFDLDNYTSANCLCPATSTGGKCLPGFYCPGGAIEPISCPPGWYCQEAGLGLPSGECAAGYFCTGGTTTPTPTDALQGNQTVPIILSHAPLALSLRTTAWAAGLSYGWSVNEMQVKGLNEMQLMQDYVHVVCKHMLLEHQVPPRFRPPFHEWLRCVLSKQLPGRSYYCPEGQALINSFPCPPGHRCPERSSEPTPCPSGFYQSEEKQAQCHLCKAGYYCELREQPVSDITPFVCPAGYFCPAGTQRGTQYGCPPGTYGPSHGASNITDCVRCPHGKYCKRGGQEEPTGGVITDNN
ncbi:multiple epidermal growth factor-like domains protein 6 [Hyperolius riggenbachi]|uniref:multiple epidermal growth factor-like domains protein 6 n=1 Tax=Hyperolius riggenbachi TaxID=752182 RepID=UPI0035A39681